jgi:type I restriction enzyme S subunit
MSEVLENRILNIDKSDWTPTKLLDLAEEISERADNPGQSDYDRFVGLEHFVSGDLKIKNWGSTKDLGSSMKVFKAGDVLFARRNAYLRRASLVEFDGICSGDAFVLRENHKNIVPGFLAFVLNSDALWDYANTNAAGTMSKRVKWRDLGEYEFLLPPKDQQARLAELLWAAEGVVEKKLALLTELNRSYTSIREVLLMNPSFENKVALGKISKLQGGATFKSSDSCDSGARWLKIANVGFGKINWDEASFLPKEFTETYNEYLLNEGDIVMALTRPILGDRVKVARITNNDKGSLLNQRVGRIILSDIIYPGFLYQHLQSESFMIEMKKQLQGTDPPNVSNKMYEEYEIHLPDLRMQQVIIEKLEAFSLTIEHARENILFEKQLQKSLINQIF